MRETSREVFDGSGVRYERDFFYDANNNVVRTDIINSNDQGILETNSHFSTSYEYEILNYLVRMTEEVDVGHNIITEYQYDANRNRVLERFGEATNGNQPTNTISFLYDERDLVLREIRADGDSDQSTSQYNYDGNKNLIESLYGIEDTPRLTQHVYDAYNRLVESTDPMGNVMTIHYDANHNIVSERTDGEVIDVAGDTNNIRLSEITYVYDFMDRMIQTNTGFFETETQTPIADGQSTAVIDYSDNSQVTRTVNDNNHTTLTSYDTANRQLTITDAKNNTVTFAYDANSNVISTTEVEKSDLGNPDETFTTTFDYDNLDRLIQTIDNVSNTNEFAYDSRNNQTVTIDALGNMTRFVYDGLNRQTQTSYFLTDTGTGSYNEGDENVDILNVGGASWRRFAFNEPSNLIDSITTTQTWDDTSRLIGQTDDNSNTTTYVFDPLNRKVAIQYADGTVHNSNYDVHNNYVSGTDANGSLVTAGYDLLDRVIQKNILPGPGVSNDTTFETFKYDGLSRIIHIEDDDSIVVRKYDSLSNVTSEILNNQVTLSVYDGVSNMISCTYPGGRVVSCTFDELERKKAISDQNGLVATYDYIGPNRVEQRDYSNNTRCTYEYDAVKRITRTTHLTDPAGTATVFDDRSYSWDPMYNKTSRNDELPDGVARAFTYDSIYRLAKSEKSSPIITPEIIDYTLDGVGNRTTLTRNLTPETYTMDSTSPEPADSQLNQYTETPLDKREYDQNGNLISTDYVVNVGGASRRRLLTYDYRNQMVSHEDLDTGVTSTYIYDAFGRRIQKIPDTNNPQPVTYFYNGWRLIEEQDDSNTTQATYVYGLYIDEVLNMQRDVDSDNNNEDFYYHTDELYNVTAVTELAGTPVEFYDYDDFGEPTIFDQSKISLLKSAFDNPYLFTGRRYDNETGLYYYRTRYLEPNTGKFTTRDTIGIWGDALELGNGFSYVGNNTQTLSDPHGEGVPILFWIGQALGIGGRAAVTNAGRATVSNAGRAAITNAGHNFAISETQAAIASGAAAAATAGILLKDKNENKGISPPWCPPVSTPGSPPGPGDEDPEEKNDKDSNRKQNPNKSESEVWKNFDKGKGDIRTSGSGKSKKYYQWDHTHNDIEVYNHRGRHLGSMDPQSGKLYKPPVNGRSLKF